MAGDEPASGRRRAARGAARPAGARAAGGALAGPAGDAPLYALAAMAEELARAQWFQPPPPVVFFVGAQGAAGSSLAPWSWAAPPRWASPVAIGGWKQQWVEGRCPRWRSRPGVGGTAAWAGLDLVLELIQLEHLRVGPRVGLELGALFMRAQQPVPGTIDSVAESAGTGLWLAPRGGASVSVAFSSWAIHLAGSAGYTVVGTEVREAGAGRVRLHGAVGELVLGAEVHW